MIQSRRSLTSVLQHANLSEHPEAALVQELSFGVVRWFHTLDSTLRKHIGKPLKKKDYDIYALLLIALYQLEFARKPDYAVVSESVKAVKALRKKWASSLVNGVLRQYCRKGTGLSKDSEEEAYVHPSWLIDMIREAWPAHWQSILQANNQRPNMYLRVNGKKTSPKDYQSMLSEVGLKAVTIPQCPDALLLEKPAPVHRLPCFASGYVSVQSLSAQLAADFLSLNPGLRVLDACAAPGGKTCHILEREQDLVCIALDVDASRLEKVKENCSRLELEAECVAADFCALDTWWDGEVFDRILLDAPCSATGVIKRHPDIKLLKDREDIYKLCQAQQKMLAEAWQILKPGGHLLYATCSLLPCENDEQIKAFVEKHPDARIEPIKSSIGMQTDFGLQLLPGVDETEHLEFDGFYYAKLIKHSD